jgi:hypothetical protein
MTEKTYRRNQVEWALWKFSTLDLPAGDEPISTFRARIKHLLQLDRSGVLFRKVRHGPPLEHALSTHETEGTGVDALFTAFDAFCLALAVDLLRTGFKQSEVLLLLAYLRPHLAVPFTAILRSPPPFRSRLGRKAGTEDAGEDRRVFLVIERVEFAEAFPALAGSRKPSRGPIFREPVLCRGRDELCKKLDRMDHLLRRAIVIEIAHSAARIAEFLDQAPLTRRGRPSRSV